MKKIVLFEDLLSFHFYPLTLTRPVFDLPFGLLTPYEKLRLLYPESEISLLCRPGLEDLVAESGRPLFDDAAFAHAEDYVFVNARAVFRERHRCEPDACQFRDGELVWIHPGPGRMADWKKRDFLDGECAERARELGLAEKTHSLTLYRFPWEVVDACGAAIVADLKLLPAVAPGAVIDPRALVFGEHPLVAEPGAIVDPGAVIDTSRGPVYLGPGARVRPLSFIEGPCAVRDGALVDGAKLRGNVALGRGCKVGGEVETSIVCDWSNKHHDGFLGHAFVGSWVNLGALSANSDLKNDYGEVTVSMEGRRVPTGRIKVGCLVGDHSKVGIGMLLNTGVVIGAGVNLFPQGEMAYKEVPSFVVGGKRPYREHDIDRFLDSAATVVERRGRKLSSAERHRLLVLFQETRAFRESFL